MILSILIVENKIKERGGRRDRGGRETQGFPQSTIYELSVSELNNFIFYIKLFEC
jgi:hypothetical protein